MANYTDQTKIENYLGRSLTASESSILSMLIATVQNWIDEQVGGSWGGDITITKYYDGDGGRILEIDPANDITGVYIVDSEENIDFTYDLNDDFEAKPRNETTKTWIELRDGIFPKGVSNIAVSADFGMGASIPDDIAYLATYLCSKYLTKRNTGDLKQESIEGYSRTLTEFKIEDEIVSHTLDKYTRDEFLL